MERKPQTFANHAKFDPLFHFFTVPVMMITVITMVVHLFRFPSLFNGWLVVVWIAVGVATFRIRMYALRVQDRVIRLEERVRMMALLQEPLRSRMGELTDAQFIALRFACDAELPALVQRALQEHLERKEIKKAIVNWRPDYSRI
jgi:Family of unknown function (DUF6526)